MKRILSRGLNYHGQCGLGPSIISTIKFLPIKLDQKIKRIYTNYGSSFALLEGSNILN
jgi:alpha-tubulin suppressor-like RCC1 family protein